MQILHVQSFNFNLKLTTASILWLWSALGYSIKNPACLKDMEFPGY